MGHPSALRFTSNATRTVRVGPRRARSVPSWRQPHDRLTLVQSSPHGSKWGDIPAPTVELESDIEAAATVCENNNALVALLESWMRLPTAEDNSFTEKRRRRIDEARLSDRKFFT